MNNTVEIHNSLFCLCALLASFRPQHLLTRCLCELFRSQNIGKYCYVFNTNIKGKQSIFDDWLQVLLKMVLKNSLSLDDLVVPYRMQTNQPTSLTVLKNSLALHFERYASLVWCRWVSYDIVIIVNWIDEEFLYITYCVGVLRVDGAERQSVSHAYNYTFFTI